MADQKEKKPELSIVIINYCTDDLVLNLLRKLNSRPGVEIILVDNSPVETLSKQLPKRNDVHYYFTGQNLGFSGGNNYGLARASGDWLFLLNSDTLVTTEQVLTLLSETKKSKYLASAPKLMQLDGKTQNNVGFFDSFFRNPINFIFIRPRFLNCGSTEKPTEVDLLTGAAMLVHSSVFCRVGRLDDKNFFMYFEDLDFSYRLYRAGIKVLYYPKVKIIHFGGASSDQDTRQKNKNYQHCLSVYLRENRGLLAVMLNNLFHFLS